MTERQKQHAAAIAQSKRGIVWDFRFRCSDGELFFAIAPTEAGALRVLNAGAARHHGLL